MAEKRIFDIETEATIDDITEKVYAWFDKKVQQGEVQDPSWKFDVYLLVKILNNFATKFVPNVATVEGKCYWHGGELYKCNVAYTGDWVPGNFTLTSVDELFARKYVLSALQEALETTNGNVAALTTYAQNVAHSIAPEFDPTRNYVIGEDCTYEGTAYIFTSNHPAGAWNPAHATISGQAALLRLTSQNALTGAVAKKTNDSTNLNDYTDPGMYSVMASYSNYPTGANNGMLTVFNISANRKLQLLSESEPNTSSPSKLWYRCSEFGSNTWASWARVKTYEDNPSIYSDISRDTDFNSLVDAGYYMLGGSFTYTNKPTSFSYGCLIVTANTSIVSRRVQQLLFSQNDNAVYTRKLVSDTWSDWERIVTNTFLYEVNGMMFHDLSVDTDLNDVYKSGYYVLSSSNTYTNVPSGFRYGFAVVYSNNLSTSSKRFVQIIYDQENADIYMRSYALSNWTTWKRINSNADNSCNIKYDSTNKWKITFGDFIVNLVYKEIPSKYQANYNIDHITDIDGHTLCPEGTDIIGPAHINGETDFIGGVHGYETTTSIKVLCDGVEQTLNSSLNKTANEIVILMKTSDISHVSLEEVWTRDIAISIKKNEILVSSKYTITSQSDLNITRMTNGGLMAAYHSIIGSAWMPTKILSPIPSGSPGTLGMSNKNFVCEFNTTYCNIRVENIVGHELPTYKGWWQNFYNEATPRLKSYFDIINGGLVVHTGETFEGVAKYSFNPVIS